jgi:hypothetical protein
MEAEAEMVFMSRAEAPTMKKSRVYDNTLSSRGISRGFVVFFLEKIFLHCRRTVSSSRNPPPIQFPFADNTVMDYLLSTRDEFIGSNDIQVRAEDFFGGNTFSFHDNSTYWTSPIQFKTWWKNNIERLRRLESLKCEAAQADATTCVQIKRLNFRKAVVSLAENIRCHFDRHVKRNQCVLLAQEIPFNLMFAVRPSDILGMMRPLPPPLKKSRLFGQFQLSSTETDDTEHISMYETPEKCTFQEGTPSHAAKLTPYYDDIFGPAFTHTSKHCIPLTN